MKRFIWICILVCFSLLSVSCTTSQKEHETTTVTTTATAPVLVQSERDVLFDERVKAPRTIVETVGNVEYTVTFQRDTYYLGDEIDLIVSVKNVSTDAITVEIDHAHALKHAVRAAIWADGEVVEQHIMRTLPYFIGTYQKVQWEPGKILVNVGRYATSLDAEKLASAEQVTLVLSFRYEESRLEIPITLHTDVPQDEELFPYFERGMISEPLYRRVSVANATESIPILIPEKLSAWDVSNIYPEGDVLRSDDRVACVMTRQELLSYLEAHMQSPNASKVPILFMYEDDYAIYWIYSDGLTLEKKLYPIS